MAIDAASYSLTQLPNLMTQRSKLTPGEFGRAIPCCIRVCEWSKAR